MVSDVRNFGKIDDNNFITDECSSINVHNVYYYLKDMSIDQLIELFNQRQHLIDNALFDNLMEKTCIYIKTQTMLMIN